MPELPELVCMEDSPPLVVTGYQPKPMTWARLAFFKRNCYHEINGTKIVDLLVYIDQLHQRIRDLKADTPLPETTQSLEGVVHGPQQRP